MSLNAFLFAFSEVDIICNDFDGALRKTDCICPFPMLKYNRIFQDRKVKDTSFDCCPPVHKEGDTYEHNGSFDFIVGNIHGIGIHR